ncbi:MAG: 2-C-methyl-D-erythritol 4-phosphate cytidylyltransferase, partial [Acidobacteriaceae bacterium]|nr:2-C-methyl-D-erythritol 4-phosphate cytidylyltransferase [Acidobacteriaceae bacterium]
MRVFVILPAAGLGTRMSAGHSSITAPKQFLELAGVPILIHTLRAFAEVPRVAAMYVAVRPNEMDRVSAQIRDYGFAGKV